MPERNYGSVHNHWPAKLLSSDSNLDQTARSDSSEAIASFPLYEKITSLLGAEAW
jgi:hypothetical protein